MKLDHDELNSLMAVVRFFIRHWDERVASGDADEDQAEEWGEDRLLYEGVLEKLEAQRKEALAERRRELGEA